MCVYTYIDTNIHTLIKLDVTSLLVYLGRSVCLRLSHCFGLVLRSLRIGPFINDGNGNNENNDRNDFVSRHTYQPLQPFSCHRFWVFQQLLLDRTAKMRSMNSRITAIIMMKIILIIHYQQLSFLL